jgi:TIR domain
VDAFISHSSKNHARAQRLERALEAEGLEVWLDDSEIRLGVLLSAELQGSIRACRALVLLWSRAASQSRWVNSEWLMALHQDVFVLCCVLDAAPLPQCLQNSVFLNLRRIDERAVKRLARAIAATQPGPTPLAPVMRSESADLHDAIASIAQGQAAMLERLGRHELGEAAELQRQLDDLTEQVGAAWPLDPMVVNLSGYHLKNAYMLRHWDALQAGRAPSDDLLRQAEHRFFETLAVDPHDPSPLNGLGSILMLQRDLDAAEFFIRTAIRAAEQRGMGQYAEAEQDLELVERFKGRV